MREQLAGGLMYHDRGYAGLPAQYAQNAAVLPKERIEFTVCRESEVSDLPHDPAFKGPVGTARALLLE
jgi:hypothetical protein